ncbi:polymerase (DNA directed), delta 2, regulatory subunit [Plakobranchus ocellatus]|uniref:Polymerase (DNA directed), delta 2, regulatory subunit n=1 Tax=Plakobranchus ocellatus TaxID=259542 RepID=A0AAV4CCS8_9GAST|nr:polymerase (DNA directed), delta 2, regulatory subunit [Plakobranchus ocellatus]
MIYSANPQVNVEQSLSNVSDSAEETPQLNRIKSKVQHKNERFIVKDRSFNRQYAHLYAERLMTMRKRLTEAAIQKWGNVPIKKLHELVGGERCIVIGTLFKHMELRPSILKEVSEEHNLMPQPIKKRYADSTDKLIIEDELQRIFLVGKLETQTSVTGVIVAVIGIEPEDDKGKFYVEDVCYQLLPAQIARPILEQDKFIMFVSGFELGGPEERPFQMQMLADLVCGQLGDVDQQAATAAICHIVVAGNLLSESTQDRDTLTKAKYLSKKTSAGSVEAVKSLDEFLAQLVTSVDVTVVPGEFDPTNFSLPQQPFHQCMLPQSSRYNTLHHQTNPCDVSVEGIRIMGTAGQPVEDIYRYSEMDDRLAMLEDTLVWGHMAPTAPDTLACYPFVKEDPFIISECPHIYFAGCQPEYKCKMYKGESGQEVLLLTVPRFSQSGTAVLVNLKSLEAQPISFHSHFPIVDESVSPEVDK